MISRLSGEPIEVGLRLGSKLAEGFEEGGVIGKIQAGAAASPLPSSEEEVLESLGACLAVLLAKRDSDVGLEGHGVGSRG